MPIRFGSNASLGVPDPLTKNDSNGKCQKDTNGNYVGIRGTSRWQTTRFSKSSAAINQHRLSRRVESIRLGPHYHNPAGQIRSLTQSNTAYNYTEAQNRVGSYGVNGLNQYTSIDGTTVAYDANGNLTADGAGMTFSYDMENRLVSTGTPASGLYYDVLGRLARVTVAGSTTDFHYDGDALVGEYVVGTGQTRRYVHSGGVDEPLVQYNVVSGVATKHYLHADHQGSIIAHSDNSGAVTQKNSYDPYGIPKSTNDGRFGYTGQTWIPQLGLNYYKARFYSAKLGRFLQTDPIFYKDDMNLYSYAGNDPLNFRDPSGNAGVPNCVERKVGDCIIVGKGQNTSPDGQHAAAGEKRANELASNGQARKVWLNRSLKTATGDPNASTGRPDVTWQDQSKKYHVEEHTSTKSQTNAGQQAKADSMLKTLPLESRGTATARPVGEVLVEPVAPRVGPTPRGIVPMGGPFGIILMIEQALLLGIDAYKYGTVDPCSTDPGCA